MAAPGTAPAFKEAVPAVVPPILHSPLLRTFRALKTARTRLARSSALDSGTIQALNHLEWLVNKTGQPLRLQVYLPATAKDALLERRISTLKERLSRFGSG